MSKNKIYKKNFKKKQKKKEIWVHLSWFANFVIIDAR